jgi:DNA-binding Lrp family transcriptional regulator
VSTTKKTDLAKLPPQKRSKVIQSEILQLVPDHPRDLVRVTAEAFGVTRQTAHKRIQALIKRGLIRASGSTRARTYALQKITDEFYQFPVSPNLKEDEVWREFAVPHLSDIAPNVLKLCEHGFTEMVNNVIDHSGSEDVLVSLTIDALSISMSVMDRGIGIFTKIQNECGLDDPRHALLELSKGKITTDKSRHSGEGIYFSSRMFDRFSILSGNLFFSRRSAADYQWLSESEDRETSAGTMIAMEILRSSGRQIMEVFDSASAKDRECEFSRTHVPLHLARYSDGDLVSRSQAKRVLARFELFAEVLLDFEGVERVGQAFADEIFRVFAKSNPSTEVIAINASSDVEAMIKRAISSRDGET